ncbi:NUDIX domain-containing protein [Streptomyces sp. NPDC051555]|uniref:NUDIX domain-containing protein n=1 Tax=Streptomyces sp. NPDC051555 TaxID=3365657 RepID=UPI00379EC103
MPAASHPSKTPARIEQAGPGYRPATKAVLLALRPDGRVALLRRAQHPDRGQLDLVCRRLEAAEWLDEAACRGATRTLGILPGVPDIELSGLVHYRSEHGAGRLAAVFATQRWSGDPRNCAPKEYSEVVWADPGGPPADCRPLTHAVLNQYVAGTLYTSFALPEGGTEEDRRARPPRLNAGPQFPDRGPESTAREETTSAQTNTWGMK